MIGHPPSFEAQAAPPATIRVVIADDHPVVRVGVATELSRHADIEVCGQAVNGDEALDLVQSLAPDVLVLDVNMPGTRAVDVLRRMASLPGAPRTLILTAYGDLDLALALLKAGAKGYLLKDEDPAALSAAVRALVRGETRLSAAVMSGVVDHTVRDSARAGTAALSAREIEVLRLLGEGQENQEIGELLGISERTVRYHLRNIYDKLGVQRRGEAIAWVVRRRWTYFSE